MAMRRADRQPPWHHSLSLAVLASFGASLTHAIFAELPYCRAEAPGEHGGVLYQFRKHVLGRDPVADFKTHQCDACKHVMHSYFETSPSVYDTPHPVGIAELWDRGDYCHQVVMMKFGFIDNFYDPHENDFWLGLDHGLLLQQHCMEFFNAFFDAATCAPGRTNGSTPEYDKEFVFVANTGLHVLGFFKNASSFRGPWESCPFSEHYPTSGIERISVNVTMGRYLSARMTSGLDFPGCSYVPEPHGADAILREDVMTEYNSLGFRRSTTFFEAPYGLRSARGIDQSMPIFDNHPCVHLGCCDAEV